MPISTQPGYSFSAEATRRPAVGSSPPAAGVSPGARVLRVTDQAGVVTVLFSDGQTLALNTGDLPIGDGASVPWQKFPGLTKYIARLYKLYLDREFPDAFLVHDFLYSPEGVAVVGLTRRQADTILYLMIVEHGPVSADIVYYAVRLGGAGHFNRGEYYVPPMWLRDP